jgi:hypothetical protein
VLFDVSDPALEYTYDDVLNIKKNAYLRNRYLWSFLVLLLVAAIITALVIALSGAESNSAPHSKAQFFISEKFIDCSCYNRIVTV